MTFKSLLSKYIYCRVSVPGHTNPLLLSTRQVNSFFSNFRLVTTGQHFQIRYQGTGIQNLLVFFLVLSVSKLYYKLIFISQFLWARLVLGFIHLQCLGSCQLAAHLANEINQGPCYVIFFKRWLNLR